MKVLVTGGCGFLGSHVCEYYIHKGAMVISYDNMTKHELERTGFVDLMDEREDTALMFGGEVVGRIGNLPTTKELIDGIMSEASEVLRSVPKFVVDQ